MARPFGFLDKAYRVIRPRDPNLLAKFAGHEVQQRSLPFSNPLIAIVRVKGWRQRRSAALNHQLRIRLLSKLSRYQTQQSRLPFALESSCDA